MARSISERLQARIASRKRLFVHWQPPIQWHYRETPTRAPYSPRGRLYHSVLDNKNQYKNAKCKMQNERPIFQKTGKGAEEPGPHRWRIAGRLLALQSHLMSNPCEDRQLSGIMVYCAAKPAASGISRKPDAAYSGVSTVAKLSQTGSFQRFHSVQISKGTFIH